MKRVTNGPHYIELPDRLCAALSSAYIINPCDDSGHDYHPAFAEQKGDPRNEEKIWEVLRIIAEDYGTQR